MFYMMYLVIVFSSLFIGYLTHKLFHKSNDKIIRLKKVVNRDPRARENSYYYIGAAEIDGENRRVCFTEKEIIKGINRAEKNNSDFEGFY
jgi:hypothetical protein